MLGIIKTKTKVKFFIYYKSIVYFNVGANKPLNNYRPDVQKSLNRINSQQTHDFLHSKNNGSKPLNNFDPNLIKKPHTPNLFNRPSSSHSNTNMFKPPLNQKPSTPDQFKMSHFDRMQRNYSNSKSTKLIDKNFQINAYANMYPSSVKNKTNYLGEDRINNRPSTAPQKDKSTSSKGIKQPNYVHSNPSKFLYSSLKRAPSPMLKSNNPYSLGRTQINRHDKYNNYMSSTGIPSGNMGLRSIKKDSGLINRVNQF